MKEYILKLTSLILKSHKVKCRLEKDLTTYVRPLRSKTEIGVDTSFGGLMQLASPVSLVWATDKNMCL